MKIGAFVIHLQRARQRRPQVERILAACPVPARVIDAVDGRAMSAQERAAVYTKKLHEPRYPFELGPGEIGCFLSHRKAWQQILDDGLDAGLIIEDDVEIEPEAFGPALELAMRQSSPLSYIQFQVRPVNGAVATVAQEGGVRIVRPRVAELRTSAQLVGRGAAERLLDLTGRFDRPVDGFLQMSWTTGIAIDRMDPSGVSDRTQATGGSTISGGKTFFQRVEREFKRFFYRRAVARHALRERRAR
ncbi:MAG: glycosyltransferase family 25 protein [Notoacmeibacter sp.]|nr:glycosyltransferase family 25 protein [Notoacmeibacter sp.]